MEDTTVISVAALLGLTAVECFALHNGIDGVMLSSTVAVFAAAIAGKIGHAIGSKSSGKA